MSASEYPEVEALIEAVRELKLTLSVASSVGPCGGCPNSITSPMPLSFPCDIARLRR